MVGSLAGHPTAHAQKPVDWEDRLKEELAQIPLPLMVVENVLVEPHTADIAESDIVQLTVIGVHGAPTVDATKSVVAVFKSVSDNV